MPERSARAARVVGVGVDIADVGRFDRLLQRGPDRLWAHWFTDAEAAACSRQPRVAEAAAVRFAAKEATYKAVGASFTGATRWRDIEILGGASRWRVALHGEVAETATTAGVTAIHATTCCAGHRVVAMVIAEGLRIDPIRKRAARSDP